MRRWRAVTAAVLVTAVALTGCAGDEADEQRADTDADAGPVAEALSWLPDTIPEDPGYARVLDLDVAAAAFDLERPGDDADDDDVQQFVTALADRGVMIFSWWRGATPQDVRSTYGVDHGDVDRIVLTSGGGQEGNWLVASGRFSATDVAAAAAAHGAAGEDVRTGTFDGVEYHVVGDAQGIEQYRDRFGPARELGRGFTIAVVDDRFVFTASVAAMEATIATLHGDRPSFVDSDERVADLAAQADELAVFDADVALRPVPYAGGTRSSGPGERGAALVVHVGDPAAAEEARDAFAEAADDPGVVGDRYGDVDVGTDGPLVTIRASDAGSGTSGNLFSAVVPWCRAQAGRPDSPCVLPAGS